MHSLFCTIMARTRSPAKPGQTEPCGGGGAMEVGEKKCLTYSHMGMYCYAHGTSGDNFGCFQCGGGAAAAGNPELSCATRTACGRDCGLSGAATAVGFETPARFARGRPCQCAPRRAPDA